MNKVENIPLIGRVFLDPTEDDLWETNQERDWIQRATDLLSSDHLALDPPTKRRLKAYLENKMKTLSQITALDAFNITSDMVAEDCEKKVSLDAQRAEIETLLAHYGRIAAAVEEGGGGGEWNIHEKVEQLPEPPISDLIKEEKDVISQQPKPQICKERQSIMVLA